jgi:hypothetical protein
VPLFRTTWAFFMKPFNDEKFIAALRDALNRV